MLDTKPELITREKTRFANYFLDDFTLTSHNKEGDIRYTLKARRLDNFEDENLAEVQQIEATFYNKNSIWTLSAGKARLFHNNKQIEFYDGVKINRPKENDRPALQVSTNSITLQSDTEILQTNDAVTLVSGDTTFQSKGLSFNNEKGILELKSNVKGRYVK